MQTRVVGRNVRQRNIVAALLLKEAGYDVISLYEELGRHRRNGVCTAN